MKVYNKTVIDWVRGQQQFCLNLERICCLQPTDPFSGQPKLLLSSNPANNDLSIIFQLNGWILIATLINLILNNVYDSTFNHHVLTLNQHWNFIFPLWYWNFYSTFIQRPRFNVDTFFMFPPMTSGNRTYPGVPSTSGKYSGLLSNTCTCIFMHTHNALWIYFFH